MDDCNLWNQDCISFAALTSSLPKHFQCGLKNSELILTCISTFPDHIIIGTNVGLVYLAHLPSLHIIRLKFEHVLNRVTCVSGLRSVDDLIAAGAVDGCVTVFLLPRVLSTKQLPSPRAGIGNALKRFSVSSLHQSAITALTWSSNGLRVVTGDAQGCIGLLEVDYDESQCVARHLVKETCPVVQLSYWKQVVALSTEEKCAVYDIKSGEYQTVGTKPRKSFGRYGVCWKKEENLATTTMPLLYTSRHGQRVWLADKSGVVLNTLLIKDIPVQRRIFLPNQRAEESSLPPSHKFERLELLSSVQLVMFSSDSLVIFNTDSLVVEGFLYKENFIRDVSVDNDMIFILSKDSEIFCCYNNNAVLKLGEKKPPSQLLSSYKNALESSQGILSNLGKSLQEGSSSLFSNITKIGGNIAGKVTDSNAVLGLEEDAQPNYQRNVTSELNSMTKQNLFDNELVVIPQQMENTTDNLKDFSSDHLEEDSPLVIKSKRKIKKVKKTVARNAVKTPTTGSSSSSSSTPVSSPFEWGGDSKQISESSSKESTEKIVSQSSIEENERRLGEMLGIECLGGGSNANNGGDDVDSERKCEESSRNAEEEVKTNNEDISSDCMFQSSGSSSKHSEEAADESLQSPSFSFESTVSENIGGSGMFYGPPSGSSVPSIFNIGGITESTESNEFNSVHRLVFEEFIITESESLNPNKFVDSGSWKKLILPSVLNCISSSDDTILYVDAENHMYLGKLLEESHRCSWSRCKSLPFPVSKVSLSKDGNSLLLLSNGNIYECTKDFTDSKVYNLNCNPLASEALDVSGESGVFFYLTNDLIVHCQYRISDGKYKESTLDSEDYCIKSLSFRDGLLWVIDSEGRILFRIGQSKTNVTGLAWALMGKDSNLMLSSPDNNLCSASLNSVSETGEAMETVSVICIGSHGIAWRISSHGLLQFRPGVSCSIPQGANLKWWQVVQNAPKVSQLSVLCSTNKYLVKAEIGDQKVLTLPVGITGSAWEVVGTDSWSHISAESLYAHHGALACLSPTRQLMMVSPQSGTALPLTPESHAPLLCIAQRPEALWLLSSSGEVWIRGGLNSIACLGNHWHLLEIREQLQLRYLSLGPECVWGVDAEGGVHFRQGSLSPPHPDAAPQAWLPLENTQLPDGASFTKVFAGPERQQVWALDSNGRVYARVGIYPDLTVGVAWEEVPGIRVMHISVSDSGVVHAISSSGELYCRERVEPPKDYLGTHWRRLPHSMAAMSASVDGDLWGLSPCGELCRHLTSHSLDWKHTHHKNEEQRPRHLSLSGDGWEVL